jgi:tetratricopeptide (TPR) repeat protein
MQALTTRPVHLKWVLFLLTSVSAGQTVSPPHPPGPPSYRPRDPVNASAFDRFYNLDLDHSIEEFNQVLERHPNDPFAVNHLLMAVIMRELYRMGAMNSGEYANDSFIGQAHRPADPKVKEQIKAWVQRAEALEEQELKANADDKDAFYARGVTRAQFALYTALIERAWFSALRNAVGARHDHERVLELDPNYVDAKLVVGAHNYVMGSLSWSVKVAVALVGLSGSKDKGLQYLSDVAGSNSENSVDAKVVLALFFRREHRYGDALRYIQPLIPAYPRNLLFALEEGNLLRAAGRDADAAAVYQRVWQEGQDGRFSGLHYELAALALGDLLRSQKAYGAAAEAYERVNQIKTPDPEYLQRGNLAAGEMYDLLQKRDLALEKYQAVIAAKNDSPLAAAARRSIREPYRGD